MEDRWRINKIGLLNYWWYDEEEFEFSDGRMILRGTNGSGKSVTMQSFIPLLLDGKKTPERLDPFGNKARKIEDYVLGYGDSIKEENTSYLYMEFYKKELDRYITVGMGLRGKKGQGVKFWGFVIKDGRRIGKDIFLYKDRGGKIPLTKQELRNLVLPGGEFVETQKDYAMAVNKNIFGFETLEEYDEFIKLLIEIRTPKLSDGKGFKPSTVIEILANSLQTLTDEDLRPVSESIDNMNKTKEQLKFLKESKKAIDNIKGYYNTYNEYLLYSKAKRYIKENKAYKEAMQDKENLENVITKNEKELEETKRQIDDIVAKIEAAEYQEETLKKSEAWNIQKELTELESKLEKTSQEIETKVALKEKQEADLNKKENELKNLNQEYELNEEDFKKVSESLEEKANEIYYDEYFFKIDEIKKDVNKRYNYEPFKQDIKRYIEKIEKAKVALEKLKQAEKDYDNTENELEIIKNNKVEQDKKITKIRQELDQSKEDFIEQMYKWEKENSLLKVEDLSKSKITEKIQNYGEKESFDNILELVRIPYNQKNEEISKNIINLEYNKVQTENKITELNQELQDWKNKKEPEPARSKEVEETRKRMQEKNIPFVPLYQAVDFKKDIDEKTRGIIETALLEMGILDALIIPKQYIGELKKVDTEFACKYLEQNPQEFKFDLSHILDVTLPQSCMVKPEDVVNTLKTILIDDENSQNYIDENGRFKIGLVRGKVSGQQESIFIGQESRKKFKEKMINDLQEQIDELENIKLEYASKIEEEKSNIETLKKEFEAFPKKDVLEEKYNGLRIEINFLASIEKQIQEKEQVLKEKYEVLKEIRLEAEEKTAKMQFAKKLEVFIDALSVANELKDEIYELEKAQNNMINTYQKISIIKENIEEARENLDSILYDKNKLEISKKQLTEKINSLKQMITEDIEELTKQVDECLKLQKELNLKKDDMIKMQATTENQIKNDKEKLTNILEKVLELEKISKIATEIFEKEINLKYVIQEYDDIKKAASKLVSTYSNFEKQAKGASDYLDNLSLKCRENQQYLVDYSLSIETIFEIDENQEEILEIQKTMPRRDITCFIKGKKVNLLNLSKEIDETIKDTQMLIEEDDRRLFEEILTNTVGRKIRERIYHAKDWVKAMNDLMETIDTSSKLSFSLNWKPKQATTEAEMDTKELVDILNSDSKILRQEEITKVANHFRSKFEKAENRLKETGGIISFHDIMKETLDYRTWFEFQFNYKKGADAKRELTNNAFFKLSGGEKAMAMYIPLFAAVTSKFQSASSAAPRIISLDEAFAGVDDSNIRDMFRILTKLDLEYIINSQVLWGEYDTIPSLAINELISNPQEKIVSVIRYRWNGAVKELVIS